jgi:carbamate kinase
MRPPGDRQEVQPLEGTEGRHDRDGRLAVVAVGGNALARWGGGSEQVLAVLADHLGAMAADGWGLLVVHGSGPQIGLALRRSELASREVPPVSMELATAETQGTLGVSLQRAVARRLPQGRGCVTVVTQTVVDPDDDALASPSKPIGPAMVADRARALAAAHGWEVTLTPDGWRRVVPSPRPREVVELDAVDALLDAGQVVVAGGGGGVPVTRDDSGALRGLEAVIDKDLTAGLLARSLGADALIIGTTVAQVALDLGRPTQRWLDRATTAELRGHLDAGQFSPGSMGPKVEAVLDYLDAGGTHAAICDLGHVCAGLAGTAGTVVTPEPRDAGEDAPPA